MDSKFLYFACVLGAAALYLALKPGRQAIRVAGGLLGLGVFVWLVLATPKLLAAFAGNQAFAVEAQQPAAFFMIFSLIALAAAVRMITHDRPVYSALYFVLVVLSSAGLFLLLQAEFMAFALIIVYAGAILITYMFVIMLAQQGPNPETQQGEAEYDINPREPAMACGVGFILLSVLANMAYGGVPALKVADVPLAERRAWQGLTMMPSDVDAIVADLMPGAKPVAGNSIEMSEGGAYIIVRREGDTEDTRLGLPPEKLPSNVQQVGLDLVAKFPVSLELAGVILLMAMFGAVVLARKQIELGEDEIREAAGMQKLGFHAEDASESAPQAGGAR